MKYTLKNCPDSEWKKSFEKELRGAQKIYAHKLVKGDYEISRFIEELLGE